MKAGRLMFLVTLLRPEHTTNAFGEETVSYVETVTADAERVQYSGRRSEEVGEHFPDYGVQWNIHEAHEVGENWRLRDENCYLYTVTNIIPNRRRGYNTLICVRVNE